MVLDRKTNFFLGLGVKNQLFPRKKNVFGVKNHLFPRENQKKTSFWCLAA